VIASASPELFFLRAGDDILVRPMKGTAPRGRTPAEDLQAASDLRASVKERAENVIIVDLMRNDLGRIAQPGTVAVTRLCTVERYETVLQMTSDVGARLRPGTGAAGGVPGPVSVRIGDWSPQGFHDADHHRGGDLPRGVYCGAIGWVAPPSEPVRARFNVAIRTAVIDRRRGDVVYGTGGGITWASRPPPNTPSCWSRLGSCRIVHRTCLPFNPAAGARGRNSGRAARGR